MVVQMIFLQISVCEKCATQISCWQEWTGSTAPAAALWIHHHVCTKAMLPLDHPTTWLCMGTSAVHHVAVRLQ